MLSNLTHGEDNNNNSEWLAMYFNDFRRRILKLFGKSFHEFSTALGLSLLDNKHVKLTEQSNIITFQYIVLNLLIFSYSLNSFNK